ncbi:MAG: DegQ family serine endoprotease [Desulfobacteraceae bacterium]|nr:DegQ family serine endoprotease [Desulfobacteraceae bacterium]
MRKLSLLLSILIYSLAVFFAGCGVGFSKDKEIPMVPANFTSLARIAKPGVVNISTLRTMKDGGRVFRHFFGDPFGKKRNPFEEFFGPFSQEPKRDFKQKSLGSGFILDEKGFIVTNNHVVAEADQIKVKLADEREYDAKIIGRDPKTDLALIKIDGAKNLKALPIGDSETLDIGTWVVAIGSPFGLEQTVTAGIVSAKGRIIGAGPYDDFIQTDASINPGNSGGPLLDMKGRVIGINTAIVASGQGIGFAIPANLAMTIIDQLKEKGKVVRGWLGIGIQDLTSELAEYYGLKNRKGVLITQVFENDPAAKAGIKANDVIISIDGQNVRTGRELSGIIANTPVGGKTKITLLRGEKKMMLTATVSKRPDDEQLVSSKKENNDGLGLQVAEISPERAQQFGLDAADKGILVVDVKRNSPAHKAGLATGDIIKGINRKKINKLKDYNKIMDKAKKGSSIIMLVLRRNEGLKAIKITP